MYVVHSYWKEDIGDQLIRYHLRVTTKASRARDWVLTPSSDSSVLESNYRELLYLKPSWSLGNDNP